MELVDVRDTNGWQHDEEQDVAKDEVGREETHLGDLAEEFATRLGQSVPSKRVPLAGPPCYVRGIGAEFSGQSQGDDELVDETLDGNDSDHTGKRLGEVPTLEEVHDLEEDDEGDDGDGVCNSGEHSTELLAAHAEHGAHTTSHAEEHDGNTGVDSDRTECDKDQADDGVGRSNVDTIHVGVGLTNTSASVHEQVRQHGHSNPDKRTHNFSEEDVGELGTGCVAGELGRGVTKSLALETSKTGTGQTNEANPGRRVSLGVATRQPAEELAVVDEEVGPRELVRVEDEGRDTKGEQRDPEPEKPVTPCRQCSEEQNQQTTSTPVDRRAGETREEDTERHAGSRETTSSTDVAGTTV